MQVQHRRTAGAFVQIIDVLRDEREFGHQGMHTRDRLMCAVRLRPQHGRAAPLVPTPDQGGVVFKRLWRRESRGVEMLP
jgi:hypothetical protein